jgi:hypothetical protein
MTTGVFGTYRPVVTDALLAFIETTFVEPAPEAEREAVRQAALSELAGAELVLEADGTLISRSGDVEFLRVRLPEGSLEAPQTSFEKAHGVHVNLRRIDADTLVSEQAGKPAITFRKAYTAAQLR